jgi:hypothetical protein
LPEERKTPPPTRLGLAFWRASLASLKDFGLEEGADGGTGSESGKVAAGSEEVGKGREDTDLSAVSLAATFCVESTFDLG